MLKTNSHYNLKTSSHYNLNTSSHYVTTLLELAATLGMNSDALKKDAGLASLPPAVKEPCLDNTWLDSNNLANLIKAMWRQSRDETMGIDPQPSRMGTWALACDYMMAAETLGELYRRGEKIYRFVSPASRGIHFSVDKPNATVEVLGYVGERDPYHFLSEFLTVTWHRFACWAIDETIALNQAFFSYSAPGHWRFYPELFQCPVAFDQLSCGYSFNKKYLSRPICRNRQELTIWLHNSPADLLYIPGRNSSITHMIKKQLVRDLREHRQYPAFDDVCRNLHMSTSVVRRKLKEEGSSYQRLKDMVRLELIKELLSNPDISISDVTMRSGFSETASMVRTFKKLEGITPAQYRKIRQC